MSTPRLPAELLSHIFAILVEHDDDATIVYGTLVAWKSTASTSLLAAGLVCVLWAQEAQKVLFRSVVLDNVDRTIRFLSAVQSRPTLSQSTRSLSIASMNWNRRQIPVAHGVVSFTRLPEEYGLDDPDVERAFGGSLPHIVYGVDLCARVLLSCPLLRHLNLDHETFSTVSCPVIRDRILPSLLQLQHLTAFIYYDGRYKRDMPSFEPLITPTGVAQISRMPSMRIVDVAKERWDSGDFFAPVLSSTASSLTRVAFEPHLSSVTQPQLYSVVNSIVGGSALRVLRLYHESRVVPGIQDVLSGSSNTLEELHIATAEPEPFMLSSLRGLHALRYLSISIEAPFREVLHALPSQVWRLRYQGMHASDAENVVELIRFLESGDPFPTQLSSLELVLWDKPERVEDEDENPERLDRQVEMVKVWLTLHNVRFKVSYGLDYLGDCLFIA